MWICLNNGFISIVDKSKVQGCLLVRSRVKNHITNAFPGAKVRQTAGTDYAFRADIQREVVAKAMFDSVMAINYDNFKNSVVDDALHHAYNGVWGVMGRLQQGGPYGQGLRSGRQLFQD